MGCTPSFEFTPRDGVPGQDFAAQAVFEKLCLNAACIHKFYTAFSDMDANFTGFIRVDEFQAYFDIPNLPINDKLFGIFPSYLRGHMNFMEMVCSVSDEQSVCLSILIIF
jgi:hypothetical protein